jgi:2-polyprenyl-3-methyl-5-hydroxy-6-metoxy-1,4-benzoquinol methylase
VVNVHIHQFKPGGAVVDAAALAQFQEQWATYHKLITSNCLCHHEVGGILRDTLNAAFASPFTFLDIACGDASVMKTALRGTKVRHYHGIDLSQPALELAAANLAGSPFEVDLDHRDFVDAMMRRPEHADAAWCGLSIHHLSTPDKLRLMKAIRGATGARGIFLLYEPTRRDNEDRAAFLERFSRTNKPLWKALTPSEWDQIWHHVTTCDFPETAAGWCELGRGAGFAQGAASLRRSDRLLPLVPLRGQRRDAVNGGDGRGVD